MPQLRKRPSPSPNMLALAVLLRAFTKCVVLFRHELQIRYQISLLSALKSKKFVMSTVDYRKSEMPK